MDVAADDGTTLSVRCHGNLDSPVRLLLTHGCGLAADAYQPFWSQLTNGYEVVVFDMRSHGRSARGPLESLNIPTLVSDQMTVLDAIQERFGAKPVAGLFHSMGCVVGLLHAAQRDDFAALVLYDAPIRPPRGKPEDIEAIGQAMARAAGKRRDTFADPSELAAGFEKNPAFQLIGRPTLDILAESTLRPTDDGFVLSCPPSHEAQLGAWMWGFTMELPGIIGQLGIPVKVIGADPTVPFSFLPTIDMSELIKVNYDFVPDLTHFLQIENPALTSQLAVEFLTEAGFPPSNHVNTNKENPMDISDRIEIGELPGRYGDIVDGREWDRLGRVFTADATFDMTGLGGPTVQGIDSIREFITNDVNHLRAHPMTNVYVDESDDGVTLNYRLLGLIGSGRVGIASCQADMANTDAGWRMRALRVTRRSHDA